MLPDPKYGTQGCSTSRLGEIPARERIQAEWVRQLYPQYVSVSAAVHLFLSPSVANEQTQPVWNNDLGCHIKSKGAISICEGCEQNAMRRISGIPFF